MKQMELVIFVAYFAMCIGIALYFRKVAGKGESTYWGANRSIGFFVNGVALFSTLVSAASFMGFLGLAYRLGWSLTTMAFGVSSTLGFIFCMLLASGPLRRFSELRGKFTMTSFFAERYNSATALATTIFVLILFPAYIVPQLMGAGLAGAYMLGIEFKYAVLIVGTVYMAYVLLGGMLSVTWTDFIQGLLLFCLMVGLSLTAIVHFGGLGQLLSQAVAVNPHYLGIHPKTSIWTYFGISLGVFMFVLSSPHIIMRLFTTKNVNQGRASLSLTAGLSLVFHLLGYIGVAAAALVFEPKLAKIDNTYIVVMDKLFSPFMRGLALAAILAAIMSTTSGMLLAVAAEFSNNLYKKFFNQSATESQVIRVAKIVICSVGLLTMILALFQTKSIGVIVGLLVEGTGSSFVVPLLAGLWWKRANALGGFLSVMGGFITFIAIHFSGVVPMFAEILISLPASALFMVIGSLVSAPPTNKTLEFMQSLHQSRSLTDHKTTTGVAA
jgi:sodium/pantothenate symporter